MKNQSYEESMKELEQVVKELEGNDLTLDESIKKFVKVNPNGDNKHLLETWKKEDKYETCENKKRWKRNGV